MTSAQVRFRTLAAALALIASAAVGVGAQPAEEPARVSLEDGVVRAEPAPAAASLEVFVESAEAVPPLLGTTRREGGALIFEPRYPFSPGMRFRVVYRAAPGQPAREQVLAAAPAAARASTRVEAIFPSRDALPENLLKLYLQFSAPMSRGEAWQRVRLLDAAGAPVAHPFLEIEPELWDPQGRRLTILFDPGRVKRELLPHEEAGSPLREGERYTLLVDAGWPDAGGRPLGAEARKQFQVVAPDYHPPTTESWQVAPPRAATHDPLEVVFPEPLDRALLESALEVATAGGRPVAGSVEVGGQETLWRFTPEAAWAPGRYVLRAATILEDLAGNSLDRPFEVDVFERIEEQVLKVVETLSFEVR